MIPIATPSIGAEELANVTDAVSSGWISSQGHYIKDFEEAFAEYCGVQFGVATSNGTTALHLALVALGIGEGDEVIVPTLTFIATANAVRYTGAIPVFVDSDERYWGMDPKKVEKAITPWTRAIIPVHLYGHPCDMDKILEIAGGHNLLVIEDCAEAHGAMCASQGGGQRVGSFGDISCFSFFANKIMTTGEGGMCLTDDVRLADKMRVSRDHGMSKQKRYWHDVVGFNYRMTNMQAAVGVAQVAKLDGFVEKKRQIAGWYKKYLGTTQGIGLPVEMSWARNVYWMYTVLVDNRDGLACYLKKHEVDSRPMFYPVTAMPPYVEPVVGDYCFPVASRLSCRGISLPSGVDLTKEEVKYVATTVKEWLGHGGES